MCKIFSATFAEVIEQIRLRKINMDCRVIKVKKIGDPLPSPYPEVLNQYTKRVPNLIVVRKESIDKVISVMNAVLRNGEVYYPLPLLFKKDLIPPEDFPEPYRNNPEKCVLTEILLPGYSLPEGNVRVQGPMIDLRDIEKVLSWVQKNSAVVMHSPLLKVKNRSVV
jgi:hypothetical protein